MKEYLPELPKDNYEQYNSICLPSIDYSRQEEVFEIAGLGFIDSIAKIRPDYLQKGIVDDEPSTCPILGDLWQDYTPGPFYCIVTPEPFAGHAEGDSGSAFMVKKPDANNNVERVYEVCLIPTPLSRIS